MVKEDEAYGCHQHRASFQLPLTYLECKWGYLDLKDGLFFKQQGKKSLTYFPSLSVKLSSTFSEQDGCPASSFTSGPSCSGKLFLPFPPIDRF